MRILITGAGEVGFLIASELYADHDVTVIDRTLRPVPVCRIWMLRSCRAIPPMPVFFRRPA